MVQDASSYVGNPMGIEFQASLFADHGDRILFKPEATPLGPCISALRDATGGTAAIFEGSGGVLLMDSFRRGIKGTIPGVELLDGTTALWRALEMTRVQLQNDGWLDDGGAALPSARCRR